MVQSTLPLIFTILGILLLPGGLVLSLVIGRRRTADPEPDRDDDQRGDPVFGR
uniref:Uncharacterized protein n=2 Tax=Janibacter limosus TaxID=53458 RepID=A0AC61U0U0_9MICO|nr:hypothetical protein [Janibacter limosus]